MTKGQWKKLIMLQGIGRIRFGYRFLYCFILSIIFGYSSVLARPPSLGIGAVIGRPQGLVLQVPIVNRAAFNMSLYYDLSSPRIDVHLDQIFVQARPVLHIFYPYFGFGGRVRFQDHRKPNNDAGFTGRIPLGLELGDAQLRGFIELAPALEILPALKLHIHAALGLRYHF